MIRYPLRAFNISQNIDQIFEVPFVITTETYKNLSKEDEKWFESIDIIRGYGFNCIYVTDNIYSKGHKVWGQYD